MTHRKHILDLLYSYKTIDQNETQMREDTIRFINKHSDCFERTLLVGHVTGSAMIVNPERSHTVLIHHYKLGKWLQPGGHCDGDSNVLRVAMREAFEETGLNALPVGNSIFDVDVHIIPSKGNVLQHKHFDVRFLLQAKKTQEELPVNRETLAVRWVRLEDVYKYTSDHSVIRMVGKISNEILSLS